MNTLNSRSSETPETPIRDSLRPDRVTHERAGLRRETKDVLQQLEHNIRLLEDMNGRLGFMLTELRGLVRR